MNFIVEDPPLRAKNNGTVPYFFLHNILISKIAATHARGIGWPYSMFGLGWVAPPSHGEQLCLSD